MSPPFDPAIWLQWDLMFDKMHDAVTCHEF
jgi:hypothetical protein